jgi:hypothetical protein
MSMGEKLMEFLARSKQAAHTGAELGQLGYSAARTSAEHLPGMISRNPIKSVAGAGVGGAGLGAVMRGGGMDEDEAKDLMLQKFLAMHGGGV